MQLKLKALDQPDLVTAIELTGEGITFGRAPENTIVLSAGRAIHAGRTREILTSELLRDTVRFCNDRSA